MAGSSTVILGGSGRERRKRDRVTTLKRVSTLIGGIIVIIALARLVQTLRRAGVYKIRVDRPLYAGDVHDLRLTRSVSTIVDIVRDDPDHPVTAGETVRAVTLEGRAKMVNVDGRGVPTRIILKVDELREQINADTPEILLTNSSDIGVTRRVGGIFEIACKVDLSAQIENAIAFAMTELMRPIPRDIRFSTLIGDDEDHRLKDEWPLDEGQLKLYGAHLLEGALSSGEGQAQLPRKDIIGGLPCLVLLTQSQFKGMDVSPPANYRSFGASSFKVSTAHSLPLDLKQHVMSRSITTVLQGTAAPRDSQIAEVQLTIRTKVIEEIN